jgi:hypothetical protein
MNERLHELIEETVAIYMKRNLNGTVPQRDYLFQEIFTELIVRECMNAVCDPRTIYLESMTESSAMYAARERIRKHFGVKK